MGCDIHQIVEVFNGASWDLAPDAPVIEWRSYDAFAILAGVRNGAGFAGSDTGDGFVPVSSPRGLPADLSSATLAIVQKDGDEWLGEHSFSWLLLTELLDYNWNQRTNLRGVVNATEFREFLETGSPSGWRSDVYGRLVHYVSPDEMARLIGSGESTSHVYTRIQWSVSYKEAAPCLHAEYIPSLCAWAQRRCLRPEHVRMVFGFDS